jgi:hypothetical protein
MRPRKSSEPDDPPELRELDEPLLRELELDEPLLRELELEDREPLLKDCPPPGRARSNVSRGEPAAVCPAPPRASPDADGAAVAQATDKATTANLGPRVAPAHDAPLRLMRGARRAAR